MKSLAGLLFLALASIGPCIPCPARANGNDYAPDVATLSAAEIKAFDAQPEAVKKLLASGLQLTTQNLGYQYSSDDPKNGGMDCSGTIYYLLTHAGVKDVPRDAAGMYRWVWESGGFHAVVSLKEDSFEFGALKPGDLLFWTGTYDIDRDPPVTHVMIYLGIDANTGRRVMVGASDGRTFGGKPRYGVSVFDFVLPRASAQETSHFIGYGPVPGLQDARSP